MRPGPPAKAAADPLPGDRRASPASPIARRSRAGIPPAVASTPKSMNSPPWMARIWPCRRAQAAHDRAAVEMPAQVAIGRQAAVATAAQHHRQQCRQAQEAACALEQCCASPGARCRALSMRSPRPSAAFGPVAEAVHRRPLAGHMQAPVQRDCPAGSGRVAGRSARLTSSRGASAKALMPRSGSSVSTASAVSESRPRRSAAAPPAAPRCAPADHRARRCRAPAPGASRHPAHRASGAMRKATAQRIVVADGLDLGELHAPPAP